MVIAVVACNNDEYVKVLNCGYSLDKSGMSPSGRKTVIPCITPYLQLNGSELPRSLKTWKKRKWYNWNVYSLHSCRLPEFGFKFDWINFSIMLFVMTCIVNCRDVVNNMASYFLGTIGRSFIRPMVLAVQTVEVKRR